jgi:cytochrome P450
MDLDAGLAPINVFFRWLPLPSYINRDKAHIAMSTLFKDIIKERRLNGVSDTHDILETLMKATYRDGSKVF